MKFYYMVDVNVDLEAAHNDFDNYFRGRVPSQIGNRILEIYELVKNGELEKAYEAMMEKLPEGCDSKCETYAPYLYSGIREVITHFGSPNHTESLLVHIDPRMNTATAKLSMEMKV